MALARFLLDTNIISELRKPRRDARVVDWIRGIPAERLFISVVTVGEIARGIAKRRRAGGITDADALQGWFDGVLSSYGDRIVPIDARIASRWGRLLDQHPQLATDMLLAATALDRGLTVATRNVEHFEIADVPVINPFHEP
jgi:predicted nucleic acid-binding protein